MSATAQSIHVRTSIDAFCVVWGVTPAAIMSRSRTGRLAECRLGLYKYLRDTTDLTLTELASLFGKQHGAIFHGLQSIEADLAGSHRCRLLYDAACGLVKGEQPTPLAHAGLIQKVSELELRVAKLEELLTAKTL